MGGDELGESAADVPGLRRYRDLLLVMASSSWVLVGRRSLVRGWSRDSFRLCERYREGRGGPSSAMVHRGAPGQEIASWNGVECS
jgi:hypothetical protein